MVLIREKRWLTDCILNWHHSPKCFSFHNSRFRNGVQGNSRWVVPRDSVRCATMRLHERLLRLPRGQRGRHLTVPEAPGCVASYPESSNPSPCSCLWTAADWSVGLFTKQSRLTVPLFTLMARVRQSRGVSIFPVAMVVLQKEQSRLGEEMLLTGDMDAGQILLSETPTDSMKLCVTERFPGFSWRSLTSRLFNIINTNRALQCGHSRAFCLWICPVLNSIL